MFLSGSDCHRLGLDRIDDHNYGYRHTSWIPDWGQNFMGDHLHDAIQPKPERKLGSFLGPCFVQRRQVGHTISSIDFLFASRKWPIVGS